MTHDTRWAVKAARAAGRALLMGAIVLAAARGATAAEISVKIENLGAPGALFFTPFWVGVHDGTFDTYNLGAAASGFGGLESIAEDGNTGPLSTRFAAEQATGVDATLLSPSVPPPFDPGEMGVFSLTIADPMTNRYFSYASMIIPSNDAFVANGDPVAHPIFDALGNFLGPMTIDILGSAVLDAGTEVNSETDVAFLAPPNGQTGPNIGADELGVVQMHIGFNGSVGNPGGLPMNILGGTTASGATIDAVLGDFTHSGGGIVLARITIVPEPSAALLLFAGILGLGATARRRRRSKLA